ncbi:hypothetical protein Tco_0586135 [Tanacetum coccineum]
MPQNKEWNLGNDDEEPMREVASKRDWFTKPKQPQELIDPDWNVGKTHQQGPTQSWLITLAATADKPSKTFDDLISTPIDFSVVEGDFPRLCINDIEDMLIHVVQNRLTNLSGGDVSEFSIALRMFTRSMVIQKRVEDLQLGVESYQKKINVTKPEITRLGIWKKDPYTPYTNPKGFNFK